MSKKVTPIKNETTTSTAPKKSGVGVMRALGALVERFKLATLTGLQFDGERDLYAVFGYKKVLSDHNFLDKYCRQDIASRIVDAPPGATWSNPPHMKDKEAPLSKAWETLVEDSKLWTVMYQADRLARLGYYSIVMFGFDDSTSIESAPSNVKELLYARAIGSRLITEIKLNDDTKSSEFGRPASYKIQFADTVNSQAAISTTKIVESQNKLIHSGRTIHVVDNPLEDPIVGVPIMQKVYNLLDDLLKVAGGTAETYWLTSNRGMQADIDKDMDLDTEDSDALSDEIEEYQHELRRIIRTRGVKLTPLGAKAPSPQQTFDMIMALISGTTGIPRRILLGSEAGQLASEQDRANWAERIGERRALFAEPMLLNPMVTKFQTAGLLPEGEWEWEWPSAFILSPLEGSMVMAQTARAIGNISRQTGNKNTMQLTSREEARDIIGLEGDLDESDLIEPPEETPPLNRSPGSDDDSGKGGNKVDDDNPNSNDEDE